MLYNDFLYETWVEGEEKTIQTQEVSREVTHPREKKSWNKLQ